MDKLKELLSRCKCGVFISVNEYRNYYEDAKGGLDDFDALECPPDVTPEVRAKILETGQIVDLHIYPDTPIGSYHIVHYDLDAAIERALKAVQQKRDPANLDALAETIRKL